ncbi:hypothetical protein BC351_01170 [Paenibacillus ferrarius]|uniref:Uncharacterized protein n=1 Tax=Paenibacillus ferrarius TaxID=1469647 RepID=A0A1V4HSS5_9BACL|nr:hypothetical protein [Paenibacillus ferrarius]OPH61882.1 hypothetical protein BC351_01170 [Paenibacillus ferrarius]
MASIKDIINTALERNIVSAQFINGSLMEISRATKRKPAFLKVAVEEDTAADFLGYGEARKMGIMLFIDREEWKKLNREINEKENN